VGATTSGMTNKSRAAARVESVARDAHDLELPDKR
jgi:hypothetical protein